MKAITTSIFDLFRRIIFPGRRNPHSRILITGIGRTGSTALFHTILDSLPKGTIQLFEPESSNKTLPKDIKPPVLVKSFVPYSEHFDFFEKKILIIRDPRDHIVSFLLYRPYNIIIDSSDSDLEKNQLLLKSFLQLLNRKEKNPSAVTIRELTEFVPVPSILRTKMILDYFGNHPEVFIMKYEDFIDQNLGLLEDFLQLKLSLQTKIPENRRRVIRSKAYNNWKNWLTPADVEFYRPHFNEFMTRFGYRDDWELNDEQKIDPATSSLYVERLIKEAFEFREKRALAKNKLAKPATQA